MNTPFVNIYSIDKYYFYSLGLKEYYDSKDDRGIIRIIGYSDKLTTAIDEIKELGKKVDVILLDIAIDVDKPLELLDFVIKEFPKKEIIVLTADPYFEQYKQEVFNRGIKYCISKESPLQIVTGMIKIAIEGMRKDDTEVSLSTQQSAIARLLIKGFTVSQIAEKLDTTPNAVNVQKARMFEKHKIKSIEELEESLSNMKEEE